MSHEANTPAKQQAVVDLVHQQPLAANRVETAATTRGGAAAESSDVGVHLRELRRQRRTPHRSSGELVATDGPAEHAPRHDATEHAGILLVRSAHALASFKTVRAW